jgi:hypothetical protein
MVADRIAMKRPILKLVLDWLLLSRMHPGPDNTGRLNRRVCTGIFYVPRIDILWVSDEVYTSYRIWYDSVRHGVNCFHDPVFEEITRDSEYSSRYSISAQSHEEYGMSVIWASYDSLLDYSSAEP